MACQLLLAVWLVLLMLTGLIGSAFLATVVLLAMKSTLSLSVLPLLRCGSGMQAFSHLKLTLRGPFSLSRIIWEFFTL